jgi:superfamily II DNA or RNA helicase
MLNGSATATVSFFHERLEVTPLPEERIPDCFPPVKKQTFGYIYIRCHESYEAYGACKLGSASNIPERDDVYATGEIKRGFFALVVEVPYELKKSLERLLQHTFKEHHLYLNGGTEFYNKAILPLVEPLLQQLQILYRILPPEEIQRLVRSKKKGNSSCPPTPSPTTLSLTFSPTEVSEEIPIIKTTTLTTLTATPSATIITPPDSPMITHSQTPISNSIKHPATTSATIITPPDSPIVSQNETPTLPPPFASTVLSASSSSSSSSASNNDEMSYTPRTYQREIIEKGIEYLTNHDKGVLVLMCGVGKTLISLWIAQGLNASSILIGVPNSLLLEQWEKVVQILFPSHPFLRVCKGVPRNQIATFLQNHREQCVVVTTYASCHKVHTAVEEMNTMATDPFRFHMKISDECHHLTTGNLQDACERKSYVLMLQIPARKQLSLTATIKQLESDSLDENVVSNVTVKHFGEIIDRKGLLWAINQQIVCDYVIQTLVTDESKIEQYLERFNIVNNLDKRLFLSAFAALKSLAVGDSHHLLIYANTMEHAWKIDHFVAQLVQKGFFDGTDLFFSRYDSDRENATNHATILEKFQSSRFGILTCVYCLGEGWDLPLLDGVVFAENMTSNIRIVQCALRPGRKNKDEPNKRCKIILTALNIDDYDEKDGDMRHNREVIHQMGLEDETIHQKIHVIQMNVAPTVRVAPTTLGRSETRCTDLGEYDEQFTGRLRLKTRDRATQTTSYAKAKRIVRQNHITSPESYYALCDTDIRLPRNPEIAYSKFFTTWMDFLGDEQVYYDLETCKRKVREYVAEDPQLKKDFLDLATMCHHLCQIDSSFPPAGVWTDYYGVSDLSTIISLAKKRKAKISLGLS